MVGLKKQISLTTLLLEKNREFISTYNNSPIMEFIGSQKMQEKAVRNNLLACIQVFSDFFQKVVMLRNVFCEDKKYLFITTDHLNEEFGHNLSLLKDRNNAPPIWDPILESTSSWFAWKMFTLDNDEKTVLIHFVLEASANIFFKAADSVMSRYGETDYFKIHAADDEKHEKMGYELLQDVSLKKQERLLLVQKQGWDVLVATCDQIVALTNK